MAAIHKGNRGKGFFSVTLTEKVTRTILFWAEGHEEAELAAAEGSYYPYSELTPSIIEDEAEVVEVKRLYLPEVEKLMGKRGMDELRGNGKGQMI